MFIPSHFSHLHPLLPGFMLWVSAGAVAALVRKLACCNLQFYFLPAFY